MIRRHRVPRGAGDSPQRWSAAWCVGPNVSFDESPRGLDRIEIVRIRWQPFHACAALFDVERHLGRLVRGLSSTTMSPRRRRGASRRRTHSMKATLFIARHFVLSTTQPRRRMAPTSVRLSPQFIGRDSTYSSPRLTHACERPIARLAPASSRNTSRRGSCRRTHLTNAARFAATSGRSTSLGRSRFF